MSPAPAVPGTRVLGEEVSRSAAATGGPLPSNGAVVLGLLLIGLALAGCGSVILRLGNDPA